MIKIQITLFGGCYYIWCVYRKVRWQPLDHKICPAKSNPAAPVGESRILQSLRDTPQKSSFRTAGHESSKKVAYVLQTFNSISIFALATIDTILADSSGTVYLSEPLSVREGLVVISVTTIHSVVSMFPDMRATEDGRILETGKFSLMHHAFLELADFSNGELFEEEDDGLV